MMLSLRQDNTCLNSGMGFVVLVLTAVGLLGHGGDGSGNRAGYGLSNIQRYRSRVSRGRYFSGCRWVSTAGRLRGGAEVDRHSEEINTVTQQVEGLKAKYNKLSERVDRLRNESARTQNIITEGGISDVRLFTEEMDARSIYVGNVDYEVTTKTLEDKFTDCGTITRVTIPQGLKGPKGFAYVEFVEDTAVQHALNLNNTLLNGRRLNIVPKRTNRPGVRSRRRGRFT